MVRTQKIKDKRLSIKLPPSSRVPIETSENMFTHHVVQVVLGKRGAGKSVYVANYLRMLQQEGKADRIIVISPTINSNKALLESLHIDEDDCFDPSDKKVIPKVTDVIDGERDQYVEELRKIKAFKEYKKVVEGTQVPIQSLDPYLLLEFTDEMGNLVEPTTKYGHRPCIHLWLDDCQSSPVFGTRALANFTIRHRHIAAMPFDKNDPEFCGGLGCSVYFCCQNIKATGNGLPRAIRNNATQMVIVGKSKDEQELKDIYGSVGGEIDYDAFMHAYEYATAEPHNSFVIDLHPKKSHPSQFRKNINEFIIPNHTIESKV